MELTISNQVTNAPAAPSKPSSIINPQEYSSLRSELASYSNQVLTIMTWGLTTTIAFLTLATNMDAKSSKAAFLVALLPLLILLPAAIHMLSMRRNIIRIASFLRAFGAPTFQYEIRLYNLRAGKKPEENAVVDFTRATMLAFVIAILLCCGWAAVLLRTFSNGEFCVEIMIWILRYYLLAFGLLCSGFFAYYSRKYKPGKELDKKFYQAWRESSHEPLDPELLFKGRASQQSETPPANLPVAVQK